MKRILKISSLLLFAVVFFASCLEDADNDVTYYSDTAIISFSVTNFNTYHTTTSSKGEDSIYRVKEDGAKYKFYIDQTKNEIYNPDSLPVGTDAEHLICSIGTARGGNLFMKSMNSDSLQVFSFNDSLDFSKERVIKVISIDGRYERSYQIKVNVHKQIADQFVWNILSVNDVFAKADDMKLVSRGKDLVLFAKTGNSTEVYRSTTDTPKEWTKSGESFDTEAYKNALVFAGRFYIMSSGKIFSSEDAGNWTAEADNSEILRLAGSDRNNIYALSNNGILISSDGGRTWSSDDMADNSELLPSDEISFTVLPLRTNKNIDRLTIIGNRANDTDRYAKLWNKISEYNSSDEVHEWNFIEQTPDKKFRLPRLKGLKVISYADGLYALGGDPVTGDMRPFEQIYFSKDGGITWLNDKRFIFPFKFFCNNSFAITTDDSNNIWLICGESGQIWRGRLNGLGWENKKAK